MKSELDITMSFSNRYLDRAQVSDAKVNELASGEVIDGGGYASCMDVKGPCECNVG